MTTKTARTMPDFLEQDRPAKVKEIWSALKRDHPNMPAEVKARIASRKGKKSAKSRKPPETGGPKYKAPLGYVHKGGEKWKKAEESPVEKQAMAHLQMMRPGSKLIEEDLQKMASLENIRGSIEKTGEEYPQANPHGDLIRARQMMVKAAGDLEDAKDRNEDMWKMAAAEFGHHVVQHLLNGGNLGEVTHAISGAGDEGQVKHAMEMLMPSLQKRGFDLVAEQARLIQYEMEKSASARVMNPDNPIVKAFSGMVRLEGHDDELTEKLAEAVELLQRTEELIGQVSR